MELSLTLSVMCSLILILLSGTFTAGEVDAINKSEHIGTVYETDDGHHEVPMLEIFPSFRKVKTDMNKVVEEIPEEAEPEKPEHEVEVYNRTVRFLEIASGRYGFTRREIKQTGVKGKPESICVPRNRTDNSTLEVQLVNSTTLLTILGSKNDSLGPCSVVLFFAPWCMFCAKIAPFYNALARAFPQMNVLAIEPMHFSSLNTRYGTIAVPNILVFYNNSKGVARFNHTERSFESFVGFVHNVTGFMPDDSVHVTPEDYEGPLKTTWTKNDDWLLWLSWVFVVTFFVVVFAKSNVGQRIINAVMNFGVEHEHHLD